MTYNNNDNKQSEIITLSLCIGVLRGGKGALPPPPLPKIG